MMKIAVFITARLGSTRLANKHLLLVNNQPIISYLIARIRHEFHTDIHAGHLLAAIVTGNKQMNQPFEQFEPHVRVFYGDDANIPLRHLQAAQYFDVDGIISVDGDDILCATSAMRNVYVSLLNGTELVKTEGLPFGMNAWGYSTMMLERSLQNSHYNVLETGWGRIFDQRKMQTVSFSEKDDLRLRFTLDYEQDFLFFQEILMGLGDTVIAMADRELIDYVVNNEIYRHNHALAQEYWANFQTQQANEEAIRENEQP